MVVEGFAETDPGEEGDPEREQQEQASPG